MAVKHEATTERSTRKFRDRDSGYWKYHYRWICTCGGHGSWVSTKRRAADGAAYHEYGERPMTAAEVRTMADGQYADLTYEEAQAQADAYNARYGGC